jgi:hypothetical protein
MTTPKPDSLTIPEGRRADMEESTYTYDDWRQDRLAEEAMRLYDAHAGEVEAAGHCRYADCYHNSDPDSELPF